uniref:Calpain catalytic domain-containing protein n=1 Tax=Romanomermis culicivorax TaxID=13658 RepID=A0A915J9G3_ROMCU
KTGLSTYFWTGSCLPKVYALKLLEICNKPQLLVGGHSRFDVKQGELGDCWLLAAMANLTMHDRLFNRVVPQDQSFSDDYAGIFHFYIWHYGRWIDVVVDDRLPTRDGRLLYLHSEESDEFWSALLEKAYAKLSGSYEGLKGGSTMEAAQDFTGGVTEYLDIKTRPKRFRRLMFMGFRLGSILACSMMPNPSITEQRLENGLIRGHAYSVTGITVVNYKSKQLALVRVRNPWGDENEWNGAWSDKSPEWKALGRDQKKSLSLQMNYYDFVKHFDKLDMCHLGPENAQETTSVSDSKTDMTTWQAAKHINEWLANKSAGGCRNFA